MLPPNLTRVRHVRRALLVAVAAVSTACDTALEQQGVNVAVAPESSVQKVVFVLNPGPLLYGLSVMRCGSDRPSWAIGHGGGPGITVPSRIVYGEVPQGYTQRTPAEPLRPGCYRVVVSGPRSAEFIVNADGTIGNRGAVQDTIRP